MKRALFPLLVVVLATLLATTPALAAQGHVYGVVFVDTNMNGVWDAGEVGLPDVPVTLESADGKTTIELMSAPAWDEIDDSMSNVCSYLDPDAPTPCPGTWGLRPAGEVGFWWQVSVSAPSGYQVTSENPQWVQVEQEGGSQVVQFGVAPIGAGGPLMPVTGAYELYAAGLLLVAGLGLSLKSRRHG